MGRSELLLAIACVGGALTVGAGCGVDSTPTDQAKSPVVDPAKFDDDDDWGQDDGEDKVLYVWAGDQARVAPDFLAVINFNRHSSHYGEVIRTVPIPGPGNVGNEAHHCHLNADRTILGCGGLLSVLQGQPGIFFFDVKNAKKPKFIKKVATPNSSIVDDFVPLPDGGFLVTNMGSATGGDGGRVVEIDKNLNLVDEYPHVPPLAFNPHGISMDFGHNRLVTSDFINPVTTLNVWAGPLELRSSLRFWDLAHRSITRTVNLPDNAGTMDVKLIPNDPHGRAITANMFTGLIYTVDPTDGSYVMSFDCATIVPHVDTEVRGGMTQILAMPTWGDRLITTSFQAGHVTLLDISNKNLFVQKSIVSFGVGAGSHDTHLTLDNKRLVVTDYFLNEDDFGKIHFEGDHKVHVVNVTHNSVTEDPNFQLDFNTAFPTGPARPHGMDTK
jgi:selenium-binding protein 1